MDPGAAARLNSHSNSGADPGPGPLPGSARRPRRGRLKVFLGAAPGVGKTWTMLAEAGRRAAGGSAVLAGVVETHGRAETAAQIGALPLLPRARLEHRGQVLEEFNLDAALARRPEILLLDELAHSNAPGSRHPRRWQEVEELRDAGIEVCTTLNVQHLERPVGHRGAHHRHAGGGNPARPRAGRCRTNRVAGSGLGLAIRRGLVQAMGGRIHAESPLGPDGRGTRVIMRFPA
jgi:K+-sensing histidine kinase KdpD